MTNAETRIASLAPRTPGGGRPSFRRRKWLIDLRLQSQFMLTLFTIAIASGLAGTVASIRLFMLYLASDTLTMGEILADSFVRLVLEVGAIGLLVFVFGLFLSHRFAGPAYRLRQSMGRVGRGERDFRVKLRRLDHLKPLAEAFNFMLAAVERREQAADAQRREAVRGLNEALAILAGSDNAQFPEALRQLEECRARLGGGPAVVQPRSEGERESQAA